MEYESTKPLFRNSAMRNLFTEKVIAAFEACNGHAELICVYQGFEPTFDQMASSVEEYDQMALNIINVRYQGYHTRVDESEQRHAKLFEEYEDKRCF